MASIEEAEQHASNIVRMYYDSLLGQPQDIFEFYNFGSKMTRVDGDSIIAADTYMAIHTLVMSLNFTGIELKNIKCRDVWAGGYVVVVNGTVESENFHGKRKFGQALFFATQDGSAYIRSDIFMFLWEDPSQRGPARAYAGYRFYNNPFASTSRRVPPCPARIIYGFEVREPEAR